MWCIPTVLQNTQGTSGLPWSTWCSEALNTKAQYLSDKAVKAELKDFLAKDACTTLTLSSAINSHWTGS